MDSVTLLSAVPGAGLGGAARLAVERAVLPTWVDVVSALGPVVVLTGALIGAALAWSATRRERWWTRTQWAIDRALGDDLGAQHVGLAVLDVQVEGARSDEEAAVIGALADALLAVHLADDDATAARPRAVPRQGAAEVARAAARLRLTVDARLGRASPDRVVTLAREA